MRSLFFFILFFSNYCSAQPDTLYTHKKYVEQSVRVVYRNCSFIDFDTSYQIVQWNNYNPQYQEEHFISKNGYVLLDSINDRLIARLWFDHDTSYYIQYYASGEIKETGLGFSSSIPYYYISENKTFFKSGQLQTERYSELQKLTPYRTYYSNGSLKSEGLNFVGPHCFWGPYKEYYENGQIAFAQEYSLPIVDDSLMGRFQMSELLYSRYFNELGRQTKDSSQQFQYHYISLYPPKATRYDIFGDTLYASSHFNHQSGYQNDMADLKSKITANLDIHPKCDCRKGIAWVSMLVTKEGKLQFDSIVFEDKKMRKNIQNAIESINDWPPGNYYGKDVDTYIYTYLILDL